MKKPVVTGTNTGKLDRMSKAFNKTKISYQRKIKYQIHQILLLLQKTIVPASVTAQGVSMTQADKNNPKKLNLPKKW